MTHANRRGIKITYPVQHERHSHGDRKHGAGMRTVTQRRDRYDVKVAFGPHVGLKVP